MYLPMVLQAKSSRAAFRVVGPIWKPNMVGLLNSGLFVFVDAQSQTGTVPLMPKAKTRHTDSYRHVLRTMFKPVYFV